MNLPVRYIALVFASIMLSVNANGQVDEICGAFGLRPSFDEPGARLHYVYGRIVVEGHERNAKIPKITVNLMDPRQSQSRISVDRTGNFCFRRSTTGGGTLIVEVDGVETARKYISSIGQPHMREDFQVYLAASQPTAPPGVVSAKFSRPRNEKTVELYQKAAEAERDKNVIKAVKYVIEILAIDPGDFIAWAKLGSLHFQSNSLTDAESAFTKSLELMPEYPPALINFGTLLAVRKQFEPAIEIFKRAIAADPTSARTYRLLGDAYLQVRKGSLGLEALNQAIRLDPVGMAECHLLIARLYDLVGAKHLATREYKGFIKKVPNHPDKKQFERYIKDNPQASDMN